MPKTAPKAAESRVSTRVQKDGRTVRRLQKEQIQLLQQENAILKELYRAKVQELEKLRCG